MHFHDTSSRHEHDKRSGRGFWPLIAFAIIIGLAARSLAVGIAFVLALWLIFELGLWKEIRCACCCPRCHRCCSCCSHSHELTDSKEE